MAKMMERYFCRFYDVLAIYEKGKRPAYREWESSVNDALELILLNISRYINTSHFYKIGLPHDGMVSCLHSR